MSAPNFNHYDVDNQMSLYTLAGQVVLNTTIRGIIIDHAKVLVGSSSFSRGISYRTPDQLAEWVNDLNWWLDQAVIFAERQHWPMNDTACTKYGECRFLKICSKSPHAREAFLKANFTQGEQWNPLKAR